MPDTKEIVVTLRVDGGSQETEKEPTVDVGSANETKTDSTAKVVAGMLLAETAKITANEVIAWSVYNWDKELTLKDDYIGQRNKQHAMKAISTSANLASSAAVLAVGVATLNPIGIIAGASSLVTNIFGIVRENMQAQEQQDIMLRQMDAQLNFTRQRAGWSLEAASIGEDL